MTVNIANNRTRRHWINRARVAGSVMVGVLLTGSGSANPVVSITARAPTTCSHTGWYHESLSDPATGEVQLPNPGGYVIAVDPEGGQGRVVAPVRHDEPVTAVVGDVYTVCWVDAPGGMSEQVRMLRIQGPDETKDLPYLMALVRIRAGDVKEGF